MVPISKYPFESDLTDPDVRNAFETKYQSFRDDRSPVEILVHIAKKISCSRDDMTVLSKLSADDFYTIFTAQKGKDLTRIIRASMQFENVAGADADELKGISAKAKEALIRIGGESRINRRRVKRYGVEMDG